MLRHRVAGRIARPDAPAVQLAPRRGDHLSRGARPPRVERRRARGLPHPDPVTAAGLVGLRAPHRRADAGGGARATRASLLAPTCADRRRSSRPRRTRSSASACRPIASGPNGSARPARSRRRMSRWPTIRGDRPDDARWERLGGAARRRCSAADMTVVPGKCAHCGAVHVIARAARLRASARDRAALPGLRRGRPPDRRDRRGDLRRCPRRRVPALRTAMTRSRLPPHRLEQLSIHRARRDRFGRLIGGLRRPAAHLLDEHVMERRLATLDRVGDEVADRCRRLALTPALAPGEEQPDPRAIRRRPRR